MKRLITILLVLNFVKISISQNQSKCEYAKFICKTEAFQFQASNDDCISGTSTAYYRFEAQVTSPAVIVYSVTSGVNNNYIIYGPFADNDNVCDLIYNYQAPILLQGNGSSIVNNQVLFSVLVNKHYVIKISANSCNPLFTLSMPNITTDPNNTHVAKCFDNINTCEDCIPRFLPKNGKYVLSAWVKEDAPQETTNYSNSQIVVSAISNGSLTTFPSFLPTGQIIDGWQRIEGVFETADIQSIAVELKSLSGTSYFDDIRIFPFDGSMMSYVYDPISLRLLAELDERNYAKFYEYDEEGKLIRVKKETEKGIMTIQENRENNAVREE